MMIRNTELDDLCRANNTEHDDIVCTCSADGMPSLMAGRMTNEQIAAELQELINDGQINLTIDQIQDLLDKIVPPKPVTIDKVPGWEVVWSSQGAIAFAIEDNTVVFQAIRPDGVQCMKLHPWPERPTEAPADNAGEALDLAERDAEIERRGAEMDRLWHALNRATERQVDECMKRDDEIERLKVRYEKARRLLHKQGFSDSDWLGEDETNLEEIEHGYWCNS